MAIEGLDIFSAMQTTVGLCLGVALEFIVEKKVKRNNTELKGLIRPTNKNL